MKKFIKFFKKSFLFSLLILVFGLSWIFEGIAGIIHSSSRSSAQAQCWTGPSASSVSSVSSSSGDGCSASSGDDACAACSGCSSSGCASGDGS